MTTNKDKAKWAFSTVKNFITGVIIPLVDIGTDLFAAGTHFWWGDVTWGCLTLLFVGMPGFVCGLTIAGIYTVQSFNFPIFGEIFSSYHPNFLEKPWESENFLPYSLI